MSNYGCPYMGSKAKIAASIALNFPAAENFYDLFGGGFAMSHYMVEKKSKRYKYFHYNEIKADVVELVKKAINGDFNYDRFNPEWISREMFFARKDTDAYVRCIWSFGNNQQDYLFGKEIEPYKKSMHQAVVFDEFDSFMSATFKITKWPAHIKGITNKRLYLKTLVRQRIDLEQLERLEQLEQLEQLQQLEQLERLSFSALDYREVSIKENSIVYCDIPYLGTADYIDGFNHKEFYEWAATRNFPVFISEYTLPDPRFKKIYSVDKRSLLSHDKSVGNKEENLYWNGK
jgi:D12 class N6 adenine-specific DNA methyltransferase